MPLAIDKWKLNTSLEAKLNLRPIALRNIQERSKFKIQEALVPVRSVISSMSRDLQKSIHLRSEQEVPRVEQTCLNSAISTNRLFLAQSPQFYKQMMVGVFDRVFETGPVFRAEKHNTKRHLNEYTSLDFEMGYIDGFEDIMGNGDRISSVCNGTSEEGLCKRTYRS